MTKGKFYWIKNVFLITILIVFLGCESSEAQELCIDENSDQIEGVQDGFRYELWNQYSQGKACMTLGKGALFSGEWSGIENYLARRGLLYDKTKTHHELGEFHTTYNCDYNPSSKSGNSYLSVYGWSIDPLIEYYIIEDWRNWVSYMSPDAVHQGSFEVDGSIYDIYTKMRVEKPSIVGITTFKQFFSIRRDTRNKGSINISEHFKKWESLGMDLGKLYEVSFVVEGYQSSGNFAFNELDVFIKK
jgi:endo-1,4-beta-xylanase